MGKLNATQKMKRDFRASKIWKLFRHKKHVEQDGLCYVTHKKLNKGANLHHLDMNEKNYTDISDPSHFVFVNKSIHDVIHTLWRYYPKDPEILDRLKYILDQMRAINNV